MTSSLHQTQCFEYLITGSLDGTTVAPDVEVGDTFTEQQVYTVQVPGNAGLFSLRYGKDAPYSDRILKWLYIELPAAGTITVEVVDAQSLRVQKTVVTNTTDTLYVELPTIVPQASFVKITGPAGAKVRMSWQYVDDAEQYISAVCCAGDTPPPPPVVSGSERRTYGTVAAVFDSDAFPATDATVLNAASNQGHLDLLSNISQYSDCLWDVVQDVSGVVSVLATGTQFSSVGEITTFLNNNADNDGNTFLGSVVVYCYDEVSDDVAPPAKIHGQNANLARLRSFSRYWTPSAARPFTSAWASQNAALAALWQEAWGVPYPVAVGSWTNNELGTFWFSRNRRRTYLLPNASVNVTVQSLGASGRYAVVAGAATQAPIGAYSPNGLLPGYLAVDKAGNIQNTFGITQALSEIPMALQNGESVLIGYPVQNGGAQALLVKPVGVDVLFSNFFDSSQYRLEAVGSWQNDGQRKLRRLSSALPGSGRNDLVGPFTADQWMSAAVPQAAGTMHGHNNHPGTIQFQFRDLTTKKVSKFATGQISWKIRQRFMPLAALVVNNPRS